MPLLLKVDYVIHVIPHYLAVIIFVYRKLVAQDKISIIQATIAPVIIVKKYLRGVTYKKIVPFFMVQSKKLRQGKHRVLL